MQFTVLLLLIWELCKEVIHDSFHSDKSDITILKIPIKDDFAKRTRTQNVNTDGKAKR